MCSECNLSVCSSRCPNAPEPEPVYKCKKCGDDILEGEKYFESEKGEICEACMEDMSPEEILKLFGEQLKTA